MTSGIAAGATIAALTASTHSTIGVPLLWVIAGFNATVASLCLLAHWDANRGRLPRHAEVVVEEIDDPV